MIKFNDKSYNPVISIYTGLFLNSRITMSNMDKHTEDFYKYIQDKYNSVPIRFKIKDNQEWVQMTNEYKEAKKLKEEAEFRFNAARGNLIRCCDDENAYGNGIRVEKIVSKGRVDYKKIPQLKDLDLEQYRSEETESFRVMEDDDKEIDWNL